LRTRRYSHWLHCAEVAPKNFDGLAEPNTVKMSDQGDYVPSSATTAAVPNLFADIDRESVTASTNRTRANALDPTAQVDVARFDYVLDAMGPGALDAVGVHHGGSLF
jgi:hypothetical protein